ncbi:MAG: PorP/SprF family type IX secretion system membrane protein [Bacteroidia bacterium]
MKRFFTLVLLTVATVTQLWAQDPEFTQFYANPLYLNPAFAGTAAGPRFALNVRNQWPSISGGSFQTYSASYDQHFDGLGGGIGAQVYHDRAGDASLSTTYMSGFYSYHLSIKDATRDYFIVKAGLQVSAFQRSIDFSKLKFGDMIDPKQGFIRETREKFPTANTIGTTGIRPDFSAGLMAFTKKYYGGFAVHHIIEPMQSFFNNPTSRVPRKYTAHVGMLLPVDHWKRTPETFISPNLLVQRQAKFTQVNIGAYAMKGPFIFGAWYRQTDPNGDAIALLIGAKKDAIKIGYSYDLTVSDARSAATGSHEVSLIVELKKYNTRNTKKWRKLNCPDF